MYFTNDHEYCEYDPYDHDESEGYTVWTGKNGETYKLSEMSTRHIQNALNLCERYGSMCTFSDEQEKWNDWVDAFEQLLHERKKQKHVIIADTKPQRGKTKTMICWCGKEYQARIADLNRGWAKSCSKRCAAIKRDYGRPDPVEK